MKLLKAVQIILVVASVSVLAACGGGDSGHSHGPGEKAGDGHTHDKKPDKSDKKDK